jgi:hypothetical protein
VPVATRWCPWMRRRVLTMMTTIGASWHNAGRAWRSKPGERQRRYAQIAAPRRGTLEHTASASVSSRPVDNY